MNNDEDAPAYELPAWRRFLNTVHCHLVWWRRRWIPHLVWYGDEVDVLVNFSADKLPDGLTMNDNPLRCLFSGRLHDAELALHDAGVTFDKGMGFDGRDWEWDFSLAGPVSVKFKRHAAKPERRKEKPRPRLIWKRGDAA